MLKIYTAELYIKSGLPIVKLFFGHKEITVAKIKAKADKVEEIFSCTQKHIFQLHNTVSSRLFSKYISTLN